MRTLNAITEFRHGYCTLKKHTTSIGVKYDLLPGQGEARIRWKFVKASNKCCELAKGECNLDKKCEIYINAVNVIEIHDSEMHHH